MRALRFAALAYVVAACGNPGRDTSPIEYAKYGPLAGSAGKGSWRFGVATAATQIEDMNPNTDWYIWTEPSGSGGLDHGAAFVGDATMGYSMDLSDVTLVKSLGVDSYRFSMEWARIEPTAGQIDEDAITHYRSELMTLASMGIHPLVTVHHFSNPIWVDDPRTISCQGGPGSANLCGLGDPVGGPMVVQAMADHATLLGQRFGDLVDEWGTVNEPINYLLAAYGVGFFPPGESNVTNIPQFANVLRNYLAAHAAMYKALKAADTVDADGDGVDASVGMSLNVIDWVATRNHQLSTDPDDVAALARMQYVYHYLWLDSIENGTFDPTLSGSATELHPEWQGTLDWLGVQYYQRSGVSAQNPLIGAPLDLAPCYAGIDDGQCLDAPDLSYCVPTMGYEGYTDGIHDILVDFSQKYPTLPMVVTEAGIATDTGPRRAENIVRVLESVERARQDGVDVRGYYHWSLTDNFEWENGFAPHFGLYSVDYSTYVRSPTLGANVYQAIATAREVTHDQREQYGGTGPMTAEAGYTPDPTCTMVNSP
jgi:beta-glucosidase